MRYAKPYAQPAGSSDPRPRYDAALNRIDIPHQVLDGPQAHAFRRGRGTIGIGHARTVPRLVDHHAAVLVGDLDGGRFRGVFGFEQHHRHRFPYDLATDRRTADADGGNDAGFNPHRARPPLGDESGDEAKCAFDDVSTENPVLTGTHLVDAKYRVRSEIKARFIVEQNTQQRFPARHDAIAFVHLVPASQRLRGTVRRIPRPGAFEDRDLTYRLRLGADGLGHHARHEGR